MLDKPDLQGIVEKKLASRIPGVEDIQLLSAPVGYLLISLKQGNDNHSFRLRRDGNLWYLREWIKNRELQTLGTKPNERFDLLIAALIGRPMVVLKEMRCPEQPRRLFGKLITPTSDPVLAKIQIEFACPECKRLRRMIVMHYYNGLGEYLKTEDMGPWIPREPKQWYDQSRDTNGGRARPTEPRVVATPTTKGS